MAELMVKGARITRRQLLALVGGFGTSALLSACAGTGSDTLALTAPISLQSAAAPEIPLTPDEGQATLPAMPPPKPYDGVEIEFRIIWLTPAGQEGFRRESSKFEALSGIRIVPEFSLPSVFHGHGRQGFEVPTAPDIWNGGGMWLATLAAKGIVLDLSDYVATWDQWQDFYPIVRNDVTYEEQVLAIPYRTNYRGSVVIRPSMFEAAGLAPEPPQTWEELNEITPKLTRKDGVAIELAGINLQHHTQVYEDWLIQAGGNTFNPDLTQPRNNTPEGRIALSQHVRHGLFDKTMPIKGIESGVPNLHAFCAGNVAIQMLWPGNVANCETSAPDIFDDLLVGPPLKGPRRGAMQVYVDKYMSWTLTKHPDAVFETLKYFSSPGPNYEIHFSGDRSMPCRKAMEGYDLYEAEPWRTFARNLEHTRTRKILPEHFDIQPTMTRWVEKAALGEISVGESLQGMDQELLEISAWA